MATNTYPSLLIKNIKKTLSYITTINQSNALVSFVIVRGPALACFLHMFFTYVATVELMIL